MATITQGTKTVEKMGTTQTIEVLRSIVNQTSGLESIIYTHPLSGGSDRMEYSMTRTVYDSEGWQDAAVAGTSEPTTRRGRRNG